MNTTVLDQIAWATLSEEVKIKKAAHSLRRTSPYDLETSWGKKELRKAVGLTQPKRGTIRAVSAAIKEEHFRQYKVRDKRKRLREGEGDPPFGGDKADRIKRLARNFYIRCAVWVKRIGEDLVFLTREGNSFSLIVIHAQCARCRQIRSHQCPEKRRGNPFRSYRRGIFYEHPWSKPGRDQSTIEFWTDWPKDAVICGLGFCYIEVMDSTGRRRKIRPARTETRARNCHHQQ